MAKLMVYYPRHEGCRFDRSYYEGAHMALVAEAWGPAGMSGAAIEWPVDDQQPFACLVALDFPDQAAIDSALCCAATPGVLADVAVFTDIKPGIYRTA
ncbi:EthD family reductase [Croceicoccus bisphenolivorans]|uniref:EthD family reductase n=1 Tax=Croceicoccus bisphenolivorans TaxID=1783232 RepID=UPI00082A72EE|nr:EthD family reductase [Croceicoccus bisphenolivorans]